MEIVSIIAMKLEWTNEFFFKHGPFFCGLWSFCFWKQYLAFKMELSVFYFLLIFFFVCFLFLETSLSRKLFKTLFTLFNASKNSTAKLHLCNFEVNKMKSQSQTWVLVDTKKYACNVRLSIFRSWDTLHPLVKWIIKKVQMYIDGY